MAETDVLYEFGREPGFSWSVFGPERSHMLYSDILYCSDKFPDRISYFTTLNI